MPPSRLRLALALVAASTIVNHDAGAARTASLDEVLPSLRDVVHTVFVNGPGHSPMIGGNWPAFSSSASISTESQCSTKDDSFTGYKSNGQYCANSSPDLNNAAHLLLASGHLGLVLDVGGLGSTVSRLWRTSLHHVVFRFLRASQPACLHPYRRW